MSPIIGPIDSVDGTALHTSQNVKIATSVHDSFVTVEIALNWYME